MVCSPASFFADAMTESGKSIFERMDNLGPYTLHHGFGYVTFIISSIYFSL